ncbi:MAG: hypothetical protein ABIT71_04460 [Vicinamibacteraceae bacterium]
MCRSEGAIQLTGLPDTFEPIATDPASSADVSALVRDAVIRLTRLVQRAAIYPAGHPTVRLLLAPFLDAVSPFTDGTMPLRLAVRRERLIAAAGDTPPQEHESKWLAGQLHGRGVSTIDIEGPVDAEELLAFARWLSGPAQAGDRPNTPGGLAVGFADYTGAAFDEVAGPVDPTDGGLGAWHRIATSLVGGQGGDDASGFADLTGLSGLGSALGASGQLGAALQGTGAPGSGAGGPGGPGHVPGGPGGPGSERPGGGARQLDPQAVAAAIQSELALSEGTGVSAATERLLVAGTRLGRLTPADRAIVKQRLADLVDRLPDEVRHQLLRVVPNDDPRKCELLTSVLDELPTQRLLDLVPRVDMKRGTHVSPFLTFLVRLCSVAARDASVSEAVETQLGRFGLPTDLVHASSDHVRAVLEQAFSQTAEHYSHVGELYQSSLNEFSISFEPSPDDDARRLIAEGQNARRATEHAARVAVALVRSDPRDSATVSCLAFARDAATRTLEGEGQVTLLAELAAVASIVGETSPDGPTRSVVQECLALCRQPMALEQLVNAVGDHVGAPSETLTALFLASGLSGTVLAVTRMTDLPDGAFRDRLGELVARQELEIVRSALTRLRRDDHPVMIVLNVLRVLDPIRAPELCRLFIRDPDAGIRRLALDMLREAPLSPSKRERVMIQAMGDHDADVALAALSDLCANQTPSGLAALTRYLSRVDDRELEQLQISAVDLLCDRWSGGASDVIATALRNRRHIFNSGPRRVSQVMVQALSAKPDLQGQAAARAWQRSAAGLWSTVLGGRREVS